MPKSEELPPHEQYIIDVLLNCAVGGAVSQDRMNVTSTPGGVQPCPSGQKGMPLVVPVLLSTIEGISHIRIFLPKDLRPDSARETAWKSVLEVQRRFPDGIMLLDPVDNLGIKDEKFQQLVKVSDIGFRGSVIVILLCRKYNSWNRRCSRAPYTRILGFHIYTLFTLRKKNIRNASAH